MLSHGDWRLDNLFFTPDDDEVIAVDWQLIDRSVGPRDLAYLVTAERRRRRSRGLRQAAFDTLPRRSRRRTASTPTREWAFEMYRYGAMLGFVYPVIAAGALTIEDPRHIELTRAMLRPQPRTRSTRSTPSTSPWTD